MIKRAFFVVGAESTGTRLATRILIAGGCAGSAGHDQPFDEHGFGDEECVVIRRSFPHRGRWPQLSDFVNEYKGEFDFRAVWTVRDYDCTAHSQVRNKHVPELAAAYKNIQRANLIIAGQLGYHVIPYRILSYEALVARPTKVQLELLSGLGLGAPDSPIAVTDENAKYYKQGAIA